MNKEIQVSVIVLSYNPKSDKLFGTLNAAIAQKEVDFEVVVCDDGSKENHFDEIRKFFEEKHFTDYVLVENTQNQGTVKNYLSGLKAASGKYTFATSPGDYIFDEYTIRDFYKFASKRKSLICFGNAVYYHMENEMPHISRQLNIPYRPKLFNEAKSKNEAEIDFYFEGRILGAMFLRERNTAIKYVEIIAPFSKFVEDATSSAAALADGVMIDYFDRNIVWYEYGTGVSTQSLDSPWAKITDSDYHNTLLALKKMYPKDRVVKAAALVATCKNKWLRRIVRIVKHPVISVKVLQHKKYPVRMTDKTDELENKLKDYIKNISDK